MTCTFRFRSRSARPRHPGLRWFAAVAAVMAVFAGGAVPAHADAIPDDVKAALHATGPGPTPASGAASVSTQTVLVGYDKNGKEVRLPAEEWRTRVVRALVKQSQNNPTNLSNVLAEALGLDFYDEVIQNVGRLERISKDPETPCLLKATAYKDSGRLAEAERTIHVYLSTRPATPAVLTNLSQINRLQGNTEAAERRAQEALELDPNFDAAYQMVMSIENGKGGDKARRAAEEKLAKDPRSWLAPLYLAQRAVKDKKTERAVAIYHRLVARFPDNPSVLLGATGHLAAAGREKDALEIVGPVYDPAKVGLKPGLNLLLCAYRLHLASEGMGLVRKMRPLDTGTYKDQLDWYQAQFQIAAARSESPKKTR